MLIVDLGTFLSTLLVDLAFAGFGVAHDLLQFFVEGEGALLPVDTAMHDREAEAQERFEIHIERFFPRAVVINR